MPGHQGSSAEGRLRRYEEDWPKLLEARNKAVEYAVRKENEIEDRPAAVELEYVAISALRRSDVVCGW